VNPPLALSPDAQDLLFRNARTANAFSDEPVTDDQIGAIYDLVKYAPTAMNAQPLRIVIVRQGAARERLLKHVADGNRDKTANAPVVAILAADTDFPLSRVTPPTGEPLLGPAGHAGWRQIRRKLPSSMSKSPATVRRTCEKQLPGNH
jgi:nitroreductase